MVMVFYNKVDETKGKVTLVHHQPDMLAESEKVGGLSMQDFPSPEPKEGLIPVAYINLETLEPFYEYVERPLTKEEIMQKEIDALKAEIAALKA